MKLCLSTSIKFFIILGLAGCAVSDLRPSVLKQASYKSDRISEGKDILTDIQKKYDPYKKWPAVQKLKFRIRDDEAFRQVRSLKPLFEEPQVINLEFNLHSADARLEYLPGEGAETILGMHRGDEYKEIDGFRFDAPNRSLEKYLVKVRDFFIWPYVLTAAPTVYYIDAIEYNSQMYDRVFVTFGEDVPSYHFDQFIIWFNSLSRQIDFIEFTSRKMGDRYRAVVEYKDYRDINGILIPFQINIKPDVDIEQYFQRIKVYDAFVL